MHTQTLMTKQSKTEMKRKKAVAHNGKYVPSHGRRLAVILFVKLLCCKRSITSDASFNVRSRTPQLYKYSMRCYCRCCCCSVILGLTHTLSVCEFYLYLLSFCVQIIFIYNINPAHSERVRKKCTHTLIDTQLNHTLIWETKGQISVCK